MQPTLMCQLDHVRSGVRRQRSEGYRVQALACSVAKATTWVYRSGNLKVVLYTPVIDARLLTRYSEINCLKKTSSLDTSGSVRSLLQVRLLTSDL
jgi:hypothetical protein